MRGVGSFMHETRTLNISDFRLVHNAEGVDAMYEQLWRHFNVFGEIEDIIVKPNSAQAFIRFQHRCMAEFVKEAMQNQSLDNNEILMIKWAKDTDNNP